MVLRRPSQVGLRLLPPSQHPDVPPMPNPNPPQKPRRRWRRCGEEPRRGGFGVRRPQPQGLVRRQSSGSRADPATCESPQLGFLRVQAPVQVPEWKAVFQDSTLPLMVDIGCGSGRFLIWLAKNSPEPRNYLGLEIRQKLVQRSDFWVYELGLRNIYFMFANASVSFEQLVSSYPGPLTLVSILCPDPHFKKRHHKRRVLQKPLVDSISKNLCTEGQVFLQSDVLEVALDMRNQFDVRLDEFEHIDTIDPNFLCDTQGWLLHNPMGIRTEREIHAELEGEKIFRRMYQKRNHHLSG
ncbi:putative tRNA (Guanine-N(7)-)-methyltransferase [Cocos nucifera]|uniref:tRNA (guanine(46)-N(7))-methyltransferase n=1 Tax=Cocos nucifera TaxID=13894 RepID=A0A8K0IH05_COCNU|nr:putative tRNA (Guanine-N(7)-)-methyltransferase [Cocos nucifera]